MTTLSKLLLFFGIVDFFRGVAFGEWRESALLRCGGEREKATSAQKQEWLNSSGRFGSRAPLEKALEREREKKSETDRRADSGDCVPSPLPRQGMGRER